MLYRRAVLALLSLALIALAGPAWAQEYTLPPAGQDSPDAERDASERARAEPDPCFYNPASARMLGFLNRAMVGGEILEMWSGGWSVCSPSYGIHAGHLAGPWAYMLADGPGTRSRADLPSLEEVEAAKQASLEAAGGDPTKPVPPLLPRDDRYGPGGPLENHAPVPGIGERHGSDELATRTIALRVAPTEGPPTYRGMPVLEPGRSWIRTQGPDGRRTWQETAPATRYPAADLGPRYGARHDRDRSPAAEPRAAYRSLDLRSFDRSANRAYRSAPTAVKQNAPSTRPRRPQSPRKGKVEQ